MNALNPAQRKAVRYIDGPCLILAGAGSGKTSVITHKIAYLIEDCGMRAQNIAAVTFTNKAAREMKERVGKLVKGRAGRGLIISTFHMLGLRILRKEYKRLGYKSGFTIFDSDDSRALLKELLLRQNDADSDHIDLILSQISRWKNDLLSPEQAQSHADSAGEEKFALIYQHYQQALRAYNALDFDDLITVPAQLFRDDADALASWQRRIRYLLVDEYQDTNNSQYALVKLLVGSSGKITVVGDDDQSIYAWRGANPENLRQLQLDFPNLSVIKLEQNYRSTNRILKAANQLIQLNEHVFEKTLWSENGMGEPIRVLRNSNEESEAERIATEILHQRIGRGIKFCEFAVLYRSNHQAKLLELKLQHHQIPYFISGGTSFFSRTEIKDTMAYLRLLVNPDDDGAFLRIINTPRRQIGTSTIETLGRYATERDIGLLQACSELGIQSLLSEAAIARLQQFQQWMEATRQACCEQEPMPILRQLISDIDYEGWLHQNASNTKVAENRFKNVLFLLDSIESMWKKSQQKNDDEFDSENSADEAATLESLIAKLILQDLLDRQEEEDVTDRVQLMTLHAAKGLEFPHVFVMGLEENILPHANSITEGNIEEERRLAYVGITRAQKSLTMTLAAKRKQFGEVNVTTVSRFLEELPQEDLEKEGFSDAKPEDNQQKGADTLQGLRALFE